MIREVWTIGLRTGVCLKWWTYPVGLTSEKEIWCLWPLISLLISAALPLGFEISPYNIQTECDKNSPCFSFIANSYHRQSFWYKTFFILQTNMAKEYQWQKHPPFRKRPYIRVQKLTIKQINKEITLSACTMKYGQPSPGSLWSCYEWQSILIKPQTGNIFYNPPPKKKQLTQTQNLVSNIQPI